MNPIIWKDKQRMLILSTHASPIQVLAEFPIITMPQKMGLLGKTFKLLQSPMHMRGMNVTD